MTKKVSLKDAFVRSAATQEASDTASWSPGHMAIQEPGNLGVSPEAEFPRTESNPAIQSYSRTVVQPPAPPQSPKKKATFNLDASLHQRLKIAAAIHSREMVAIVEDALQAYLPVLDKKAG